MTAKGYNLTWVEFDDDAFDADQPMSCYRAFQCLHNTQHLIDSSGQYRVGVAAVSGGVIVTHSDTDDKPGLGTWDFPLTMMRSEYPPHFDVRVAAMITGGCTTARIFVQLVGFNDSHNTFGGPEPTALYYASDTTTSTTATWVIDEQKTWAISDRNYMRMRKKFSSVTEGGTHDSVEMVMVRFEVGIEGTYTSAGTSRIVGVQFREYA